MQQRYFDYNATTPLWPEAKAAWLAAVDAHWLNPSSPYRAAAAVQVRFDDERAWLAEQFAVSSEQVLYNSGATEGNNSVISYWAATLSASARIAVSPLEHPSVLEAAKHYFADRLVYLPLDEDGVVTLEGLEVFFESNAVRAVSMMAANNETGMHQPWQALAAICRKRGIEYHCDGSQWIGKASLDGLSLCHFITGCAHKFGGPRGVGFLILPNGSADFRSFLGGSQQRGYRAGTEDFAGVVAMHAALRQCLNMPPAASLQMKEDFIQKLCLMLPEVQLIGAGRAGLWNTVSLLLPEFRSARWIAGLERVGFLVSAGSACSTGQQGPSHVLAAMGVDAGAMRRVVRVSSGWMTTSEDWDDLVAALLSVYHSLRAEDGESTAKVISID